MCYYIGLENNANIAIALAMQIAYWYYLTYIFFWNVTKLLAQLYVLENRASNKVFRIRRVSTLNYKKYETKTRRLRSYDFFFW